MTIEEIKAEMQQIEARVEQLGRELELAENERKTTEVPETLDWNDGDNVYLVNYGMEVEKSTYLERYAKDKNAAKNHSIFKTEEFAEIFREKTQSIADLLHFKWLYDRDYTPNWKNRYSDKWYIFYDNSSFCEYVVRYTNFLVINETIYFSSKEIAQKCADWLNSRNTRNKNE